MVIIQKIRKFEGLNFHLWEKLSNYQDLICNVTRKNYRIKKTLPLISKSFIEREFNTWFLLHGPISILETQNADSWQPRVATKRLFRRRKRMWNDRSAPLFGGQSTARRVNWQSDNLRVTIKTWHCKSLSWHVTWCVTDRPLS